MDYNVNYPVERKDEDGDWMFFEIHPTECEALESFEYAMESAIQPHRVMEVQRTKITSGRVSIETIVETLILSSEAN